MLALRLPRATGLASEGRAPAAWRPVPARAAGPGSVRRAGAQIGARIGFLALARGIVDGVAVGLGDLARRLAVAGRRIGEHVAVGLDRGRLRHLGERRPKGLDQNEFGRRSRPRAGPVSVRACAPARRPPRISSMDRVMLLSFMRPCAPRTMGFAGLLALTLALDDLGILGPLRPRPPAGAGPAGPCRRAWAASPGAPARDS